MTAPRSPAIIHGTSLGSLRCEQLTENIGAEINGISLADAGADGELFAEIRGLWLRHKVLFFRNQPISRAEFAAFAGRFGKLEGHAVADSHADYPGLIQIRRGDGPPARENGWHCDGTWRPAPPEGAVLRCHQCPPHGGDTMWANMVKAYADLDDDIKRRIANLYARHSFEATFGAELPRAERHTAHARYPDAEHPVVAKHPETGEAVLYVNAFTSHITNFYRVDLCRYGIDFVPGSSDLLRYLAQRATIPEYQVRWRWSPDSFAVWDNRSTQHLAVQDYHPAVREMERATIVGTALAPAFEPKI